MQVFSHIRNILFPSHCLVCKTKGSYLCSNCKQTLQIHPDICPWCHKASLHGTTCFHCKETKKSHLDGILIAFRYNTAIKKSIYAIKFHHRYDVAHFLSEQLLHHICSHPILSTSLQHTCITRVPSHRSRRRFQKWYNQSKILAVTTGQLLGCSSSSLVDKIKKTVSQVSLSRSKRLQNLLGAFQAKKHSIELWPEIKRILIIDDITTTGSTLEHISISIKSKYPSLELRWVVVARHW
jgi:predicted amidophosphoribosyltransferase